ncbi:apicomplexan specific [Cryptosporidium xiaoi]|uniref:Apicomplexan specific n=1 Tax=Cryptosporidium xiaoi TaxID=659607 RepID=A0AAV9XZU5_9CRYT
MDNSDIIQFETEERVERTAKKRGVEAVDNDEDEEGYEPYIKYLQALSMSWSSCQASSMLTKDLVDYIVPRFQDCSTPIKVRIIMSILYINDSLRIACKDKFMSILNCGELDRDDWVRKLSRLLIPYVQKGVLDLGETDTETAFKILRYLDELRMKEGVEYRLKPPLESIHMCDPLTDESMQSEIPYYNIDYDNFVPQKDFELLLQDIEKNGIQKMRMLTSQQNNKRNQNFCGFSSFSLDLAGDSIEKIDNTHNTESVSYNGIGVVAKECKSLGNRGNLRSIHRNRNGLKDEDSVTSKNDDNNNN